jgi:glycerol-3-phosphate dehydrogenase
MSDGYDVVVVGGGIHGAGVAQAAAAAGHSVLVLEKRGVAAGTSSRSSKLIHGGLRYLETGQFGLVFESLSERARLLRLAPDLVRLQRFHLPVYATTRRRPWQLAIGLSLYALLAGGRRGAGFGIVPRRRWHTLDGLRTDGLQHVLYYHDGQTDDARLTAAVMRSACALGAVLAQPAELVEAELRPGRGAESCMVRYDDGGRVRETAARVIVNAAGPWVTQVLGRVRPAPALRPIELVQGTHILVEGRVEEGVYYVESPRDGRAVFVMPWYGRTLVGTTETRYRGDPDDVQPLGTEVHYLGRVLEHYFPHYEPRGQGAIVGAFAGLRVLPAGEGHAFHRPRETMLDAQPDAAAPALLTIYGGKLTGYRSTAEKVLARIAGALPRRRPRASTRELPLVPADGEPA